MNGRECIELFLIMLVVDFVWYFITKILNYYWPPFPGYDYLLKKIEWIEENLDEDKDNKEVEKKFYSINKFLADVHMRLDKLETKDRE